MTTFAKLDTAHVRPNLGTLRVLFTEGLERMRTPQAAR
jgi:hypothetical protein